MVATLMRDLCPTADQPSAPAAINAINVACQCDRLWQRLGVVSIRARAAGNFLSHLRVAPAYSREQIGHPMLMFPEFIQRRLESALVPNFELASGLQLNFVSPPDSPALFRADSMSWQVFKNPLTLYIGGVAAVILQLSEPRVRSGVWNHSSFRSAPLRRMQRTGLAALMTVYGPADQTALMIAQVRKIHACIRGITEDGRTYDADDPELLNWVHATTSFGFSAAYHCYARNLSGSEFDRMLSEGCAAAQLYGVTRAPRNRRELYKIFTELEDQLEASTIIGDFLHIMEDIPGLGHIPPRIQRLIVKAAVGLVPSRLRRKLGLHDKWKINPLERKFLRSLAYLGERLVLRNHPAVQACQRLGLPEGYLYS